jgi:hypothetical protein
MINISLLQEQVGDILETLTELPAIVEEQEGHPPADNYLAYKFKGWMQMGHSASEYESSESITYNTQSLWAFTLNVMSIGVAGEGSLIQLSHKLSSASVRQMFIDIGITYLNKDSIKPAPKILSTGWEQRSSLDINFTTVVQDSEEVNFFEFLEITTTIKDFNDNTIIEDSFTVDIIP